MRDGVKRERERGLFRGHWRSLLIERGGIITQKGGERQNCQLNLSVWGQCNFGSNCNSNNCMRSLQLLWRGREEEQLQVQLIDEASGASLFSSLSLSLSLSLSQRQIRTNFIDGPNWLGALKSTAMLNIIIDWAIILTRLELGRERWLTKRVYHRETRVLFKEWHQ